MNNRTSFKLPPEMLDAWQRRATEQRAIPCYAHQQPVERPRAELIKPTRAPVVVCVSVPYWLWATYAAALRGIGRAAYSVLSFTARRLK
jgi:hypothetical protein